MSSQSKCAVGTPFTERLQLQPLWGCAPREHSLRKGKDYWFIQSAVALAGPHTGEYVVGVGWNDSRSKQ